MTPLEKIRQLLANSESLYDKVKHLSGSFPAYMNGRVTALREAVAILEAEAVERSALFEK